VDRAGSRENRGKWPAESVGPCAGKTEKALDRSKKSPRILNSLALLIIAPAEPTQAHRALDLTLAGLEEASGDRAVENPLRETLVDVLSVLGQERKELGSLLELLPSLPTYAGIDAVLASLEDPSKADAALKELEPQGTDENTKKRFLYLEGSLLLAGKKAGEAAEKLKDLCALDPERPEPALRLRKPISPRAIPRERKRPCAPRWRRLPGRDRRLWDLWLRVSFGALQLPAAGILAAFPKETNRRERGGAEEGRRQAAEDYRESVRWLLECVQAGEPIRLNCGGEE